MVWKKRIFGPGPERLANTFFNDLADQVKDNSLVSALWRPGVVFGCEPTFSGHTVQIKAGAVLSVGRHFELAESEPEKRTLTIDESVGVDARSVWVYVNAKGELAYTIDVPPGWPDHVDPLVEVEPSFCVLGWAALTDEGLKEPRDVRRFVRSIPNDAILVVGDVNAGADFENLHQALDYLEACDLANRPVSRHIVVTQSFAVEKQLQVKVPGVRIEARPTGASPGVADSEQLTLEWSYGGGGNTVSPVARGEIRSLFNLHGNSDFQLDGFHLKRVGSAETLSVPCAVWNPGDRLRLSRCTVDTNGSARLRCVIGCPDGRVLSRFLIENSRISNVDQGLIWFAGEYQLSGINWNLYRPSTGCLAHSIIRRNDISVLDDRTAWTNAFDFGLKKDLVYAAIDCGRNNTSSLHNRLQENKITGGFASIRLGPQSKARNNVLEDVALYGVWVDNSALLAMDADSAVLGATEVSGNVITLLDETPEVKESKQQIHVLPWWRSAVRLELGHCSVAANRIDLNDQISCGIGDGYSLGLQMVNPGRVGVLDPSEAEPLDFFDRVRTPPPPIEPLRVADNEYAHGIVTLRETDPGIGIHITPEASDYLSEGDSSYAADRVYDLPVDDGASERRTLQILVRATHLGQAHYRKPRTALTPLVEATYLAHVDQWGITGIFDVFRDPPSSAALVKGNDIKGNDIKELHLDELINWTASRKEGGTYGDAVYARTKTEEMVIVGTSKGWLVWLDPYTGAKIREVELRPGSNDPVVGLPAIGKNTVLVCTKAGWLHCRALDTGKEVWTSKDLGDGVQSSPAIGLSKKYGDEVVFVVTKLGKAFCLLVKDGSLYWWFKIDPVTEVHTDPCYAVNSSDERMVVIGAADKNVYFLEVDPPAPPTGQQFQDPIDVEEVVSSSPVAYCGGSYRASVYLGAGSKLWGIDIDRFAAPDTLVVDDKIESTATVYGNQVYFGANDSKLHRCELDLTGVVSSDAVGAVKSRPLVYQDRIYFGCAAGRFYCRRTADFTECYTYEFEGGTVEVNGPINASPIGPLVTPRNLATEALYSFMWERVEGDYLTPPLNGFGVLLLSKHGRVSGNRINSVSCGIFVLDNSKIGENTVVSAWTGIVASRNNAIYGNQIWWYRNYCEEAGLVPESPFFVNRLLSAYPWFSGILVSTQSTVTANQVRCMPYQGTISPMYGGPAGIALCNVPLIMLGLYVGFPEKSDPEVVGIYAIAGGNVAQDNTVDLGIDASRLVIESTSMLDMPPEAFYTGIVSFRGLLGSLPEDLLSQSFYPQFYFDLEHSAFNIIAGNRVVRCGFGHESKTTDVVRDCWIQNVVLGMVVMGARIEGCHVSQNRIIALHIRAIEQTTGGPPIVSTASDSVFMLPEDPTRFVQVPEVLEEMLAVHVATGPVTLSNCFIANHYQEGILWQGKRGSCVGCYFYTMEPDASWDPEDLNINVKRHAAIHFDGTHQGNLVAGAQMAHSAVRVWNKKVIQWEDFSGPIQNAGDNPCPPKYDNGWTNRINWETADWGQNQYYGTCYYLTMEIEG